MSKDSDYSSLGSEPARRLMFNPRVRDRLTENEKISVYYHFEALGIVFSLLLLYVFHDLVHSILPSIETCCRKRIFWYVRKRNKFCLVYECVTV